MTLIRYEPWSALNQLHGQINRLFDAELDRDTATSAATADWIPQADIEEYADRFVLKLDVPGVDLAAVEITLDKGLLSLSGERAKDASGKDVQRTRIERRARPLPSPLHVARHRRCSGRARDRSQRHRRGDDSEAAEGSAAPHPGRDGLKRRRRRTAYGP